MNSMFTLPASKNTPKNILFLAMLAFAIMLPGLAMAKADGVGTPEAQRYIVELQDLPLAAYYGGPLSTPTSTGKDRLQATTISISGESRLDTRSPGSLAYLEFLTERRDAFLLEASHLLGRQVNVLNQYEVATNGVSLVLSEREAAILEKSAQVKSIWRDQVFKLDTYAGPQWIGAGEVWSGESGFAASSGEGTIIGIIDSGINWDSPSFEELAEDGYMHVNPLGQQLGYCTDEDVPCNNKLIGVYDFITEDSDATDDVVEENTKGKDVSGHGSHVASIAAGNPVGYPLSGEQVTLSGVAPRANLITYRVCHEGDCFGALTLQAIDQAIHDGVDVLNYSVGGDADNPWTAGVERAFLNARSAGIVPVTSAGNSGPNPGTIGSPANAPWMVGVGNATHNAKGPASIVKNMVGGNTSAPEDIVGSSLTGGTGQLQIVHARDYGNALCGEGDAELQSTCAGNQGLSNPWDGEQPFTNKIVVCDRGKYGRIEKSRNVLLAGASGYILANTEEQGEHVVPDEHCLPASHIGSSDGDVLRDWLASGTGHGATISGFTEVTDDIFGDEIAFTSARGPTLPPVEDTLKPNLIAPGTQIVAAYKNGDQYLALSGTSMSSPAVAGGMALLKSVHTNWSPSQIISSMELTATSDDAWNDASRGGLKANIHDAGAGRPRLGEAVNAGLFLDETNSGFHLANPANGGDPKNLNLTGMVDASCQSSCSITRTVTDQMGGGSWFAAAEEFPAGVSVSVSPSNFTIGNGVERSITVTVTLSESIGLNEWVYGKVRLTAAGSPDLIFPVAVLTSAGELPSQVTLNDNRNGGWQEVTLSQMAALPDLTLQSGGLVKPETTVEVLVEDPTNDDPYNGDGGVLIKKISAPNGIMWLTAETLASTSEDLDLFVGVDSNDNGSPNSFEELCTSTSPDELEHCELFDLPPGEYWILVQNWTGTDEGGDEVTLITSAVTTGGNLAVSGPGKTALNESFKLRLSWDNVNALPGEVWKGMVSVGSTRTEPGNVGFIPVQFVRNGIAAPETFPLMEGMVHHLALDANTTHDKVFIDVPPGAGMLTVFTNGADADQNNGLTLSLKRLDFDEAFSEPPFAASPANAPVLISTDGVGGEGPSISVVSPQAGRWYAQLTNRTGSPTAVDIRAEVELSGVPVPLHPGLWEPNSRPGLGQGYDFNWSGSNGALIWYTYDEAGQPAWYIANAPATNSNIWTTDLLRVTNDGARQQLARVGSISVTNLAEQDAMFSYTLFGQSGTERMQPISLLTCPDVDGSAKSYTGIWYRGVDGLGGASVLVNSSTQAQIHYLFDDDGAPRWLYAQDLANPAPTNSEMPILQFKGYCAVCAAESISNVEVGVLGRVFNSESEGNWTLDYMFEAPLSGSVNRTDQIMKITDRLNCL